MICSGKILGLQSSLKFHCSCWSTGAACWSVQSTFSILRIMTLAACADLAPKLHAVPQSVGACTDRTLAGGPGLTRRQRRLPALVGAV